MITRRSIHAAVAEEIMLNANDSVLSHRLQNALLFLLSILLLPLSTCVLITSYVWNEIFPSPVLQQRILSRNQIGFLPRTILVTGVSMTKGLVIARLLFQAGHDVIGADFEPNMALVCGRMSRALRKFYKLQQPTSRFGPAPYVQGLIDIIECEHIDLWVSCSSVASAVEDGEAKEKIEALTQCKSIQFDIETTQMLHEKHSFINKTKEIGLAVPETHETTDRTAVESILRKAKHDRKFIMKPIGMDDSARGDMTILPRPTKEQTSKHLAQLKISKSNPWILQQFVEGPEFCTHALVIHGKVRAFVACPSAELLMHYEALPAESKLSQEMLKFTKHYAASFGADFTGHLSFDFLVEEQVMKDLERNKLVLYPIECNPRAHTAVALFGDTIDMAAGYISAIEGKAVEQDAPIVVPMRNDKYYWIGHDLVTLVLLPLYSILTLNLSLTKFTQSLRIFVTHLLFWRDGTFEVWDPVPWWWLYHIYWPMRFLVCFRTGKKWSRINVSTTKMFEC